MNLKKISLFTFLLLISVTPFVQSSTDQDLANTFSVNVLPTFIPPIMSAIRWISFIFTIILLLLNVKFFLKIISTYYLITVFYFIQLSYAIVTLTEIGRYFSLTLFATTVPFFVFYTLYHNKKTIKYSTYVIYFLTLFSILFNYKMILSGQRFTGFSNNSNLYAITAMFWLVILIINKNKSILNTVFIMLILISIFFTGSRNGFVGLILILFLQYKNNTKVLISGGITLVLLLFIALSFVDISFVTDRLSNIGNSTSDSGRDIFWDPAIHLIKSDPWWGYGMDANLKLVGTHNIHNVYLRYLLNMGVFFTLLSFGFYFLFVLKILCKHKIIPGALLGFLIAFTLNNFGEDFLVGIGSSIIVYFMFIIGFIVFHLKVQVNDFN